MSTYYTRFNKALISLLLLSLPSAHGADENIGLKDAVAVHNQLAKHGTLVKQSRGLYTKEGELQIWEDSYIDLEQNEIIGFDSARMPDGLWKGVGTFGYRRGQFVEKVGRSWAPLEKSTPGKQIILQSLLTWISYYGLGQPFLRNSEKALSDITIAKDPKRLTDALDAQRTFDKARVLKEGWMEFQQGSSTVRARLAPNGLLLEGWIHDGTITTLYVMNSVIAKFDFGNIDIPITIKGKRVLIADSSYSYEPGKGQRLGVRFSKIDGAYVTVSVAKGGPAEKAGITVGGILKSVNGVAVDGVETETLRDLLRADGEITVLLDYGDGKESKITLGPVQ
jgi:hypothetical protein